MSLVRRCFEHEHLGQLQDRSHHQGRLSFEHLGQQFQDRLARRQRLALNQRVCLGLQGLQDLEELQ